MSAETRSFARPEVVGAMVRRQRPARLLRMLAGVDEDILARVPGERPRYTALGGVVLGTATIAAFSMSLALREVLGQPSLVSLIPVLGWGLFVLNLDRWLVSGVSSAQWRSRLGVFLPRIALAVLFGVIIAEPIVLRVFQTAVEQRVLEDRQQALLSYESGLQECNGLAALAAASGRDCANLRLVIAVPTAQSLQAQLAGLERQERILSVRIVRDSATLQRLNDTARRECNGERGEGLSGLFGVGPNCTRNRSEADRFAQTHDIARDVRERRTVSDQIEKLQGGVAASGSSYESALRQAIRARVDQRRQAQGPIGLLERFSTLDELISENRFLWFNRWFITLFFIVIDCMPVIVKLASGSTHYERMLEDRLAADAEAFREETRTRLTEQTMTSRIRGYQAETTAQLERDRVDVRRRAERARMNEEIDHEVVVLARSYLAQARDREGTTTSTPPA